MTQRASRATHGGDETTAVCGLTKAQLRPIVERLAGEAVVSFAVSARKRIRGHQGYGGAKAIPTFTYKTHRRTAQATVFAKASDDQDQPEARNYAHLVRLGGPVPAYYGSVDGPDRTHVIFLEYVRTVGESIPFRSFTRDPKRLSDTLAAIARFNAIQPDGRYRATLGTGDSGSFMEKVPAVLEQLWSRSLDGELGQRVGTFCRRRLDVLPLLMARPARVAPMVASMPVGLCHTDFYPDCVGWREGSGEPVVFDLESVAMGPRFEDAAILCGAPPEIFPHCLSQPQMARHYLKHYVRGRGRPATVEAFLHETAVLWEFRTLGMLWFSLRRAIDGQVDHTPDPEKGRRAYRHVLAKSLQGLLLAAMR